MKISQKHRTKCPRGSHATRVFESPAMVDANCYFS